MTDELIPAELVDAPPFASELDEALLAGRELPDTIAPWQIENVDQAEWVARKLAVLDERANEVRRVHAAWRQRIDDDEVAELRRLEPGIEFFTSRLKLYALRRRRIEGGKVRDATTYMPSAEVSTRQASPKVILEDEEAFLAWAGDALPGDEYEAVVKTTEKVLLPVLARATKIVDRDGEPAVVWTSTGALVVGCRVEQAPATATVQLLRAELPAGENQ